MAIRNDLTIDWDLSPRIITVASPSVEIAMQDLLDTMRFMEAESAAMDDPSIIDAAGKEELGGGVEVGLTITLLNATVAFEARSGPSWIQCNILGGNLVALDIVDIPISPISPTAYVQVVLANSSSATLIESTTDSIAINEIHDAHFKKRVWDRDGNTITIYDEDEITPLYIFNTNADMSVITPTSLEIFNIINLLDNVIDGANNVVL